MAKPTGFLEHTPQQHHNQDVSQRVKNFEEFRMPLDSNKITQQATRCMDCGIPYCHSSCPVHNIIPDWNDLLYQGQWEKAAASLDSTNNFPEITGRICPAPCESACTLNIRDVPVSIKDIECAIADKHLANGGLNPRLATNKRRETVAIVGSGPSGLACAQQLARMGYGVHVFEQNAYPGGLLRYGIPDFKLSKRHIEKRCIQMEQEGVVFHCSQKVGKDLFAKELRERYDALVFAIGADAPRDLDIKGRKNCEGVHFAMNFLTQQNRLNAKERWSGAHPINAKGKNVIVIGGGDTGSDCIGTAFRQGANKVIQLEITPRPPDAEEKKRTWPLWPNKMRTSTSQEEGKLERLWSTMTQEFRPIHDGQKVVSIEVIDVDRNFQILEGTQRSLPCDLVLLAMGFVGSGKDALRDISLDYNDRGLPTSPSNQNAFATNQEGVFTTGDFRRGQSLVVWAIREGRQCAEKVEQFLLKS